MKKAATLLLSGFIMMAVSASPAGANEKSAEKRFRIRSQEFGLSVQQTATGTDIFLSGVRTENLSKRHPGENLFPEETVQDGRLYVSWVHFRTGDVRLCFYDSQTKMSLISPAGGFTFVSSPQILFHRGSPRALIFRGNNTDNDDLFILDLADNTIRRIRRTEGNEKTLHLNQESGTAVARTETLLERYTYRIDTATLQVSLERSEPIRTAPSPVGWPLNAVVINTMIAFGDSITYGEMRMYDLVGEYHPELTYLALLRDQFNEEYGQTYIINLGDSGTNSYHGVARMDEAFSHSPGYFCLILYGTNDVGKNSFSAVSSAENLEWMCLNARHTYGLYPIISTIPPVKLWDPGVQYFKENTEALNALIIEMANRNHIPYIHTYNAFFNHPEGWEACLEDIKGNHPSPLGHEIMAGLFKPTILEHPPRAPHSVNLVGSTANTISLQWSENFEFDFGHYRIEFGHSPTALTHVALSDTNDFSFLKLPNTPASRQVIHFRVQAVDSDGNGSGFTPLNTVEFDQ